MTKTYTQVPPDSTGDKLDMMSFPRGADTVHSQGVYFAGLAFGLRDALHEAGGRFWVFGAIATGAALSWWVSDAVRIPGGHVSIAVASGIAFACSELADLAVYSPLRGRLAELEAHPPVRLASVEPA